MAIKFFLIYIGSLLACCVALTMMAKQLSEGFSGNVKKPVLYGTFSSVIASLATYASSFITNHLFVVFWFFAAIFLSFGIIHLLIFHKKYFYAHRNNASRVLAGELMFALSVILFTIVIFSSLQYFLTDRSFLFFPMLMSTLAFFIPILFLRLFNTAYSIPPPEFTTWAYPLHKAIDLPPEDPNEQLLVIGFMLAKKETDTQKTYFRAKAPETMKLGELYYHFINDYNELNSEKTIRYAGKEMDAHEWWFRRKPKWYQFQRILDPGRTMRENGIRENSVIICERIHSNAQSEPI
jgi:hypothetical protein